MNSLKSCVLDAAAADSGDGCGFDCDCVDDDTSELRSIDCARSVDQVALSLWCPRLNFRLQKCLLLIDDVDVYVNEPAGVIVDQFERCHPFRLNNKSNVHQANPGEKNRNADFAAVAVVERLSCCCCNYCCCCDCELRRWILQNAILNCCDVVVVGFAVDPDPTVDRLLQQ